MLVVKLRPREVFSFQFEAKKIKKYFGKLAIASLMILFIEEDNRNNLNNDEFKILIEESNDYRYLRENNNGNDEPFIVAGIILSDLIQLEI